MYSILSSNFSFSPADMDLPCLLPSPELSGFPLDDSCAILYSLLNDELPFPELDYTYGISSSNAPSCSNSSSVATEAADSATAVDDMAAMHEETDSVILDDASNHHNRSESQLVQLKQVEWQGEIGTEPWGERHLKNYSSRGMLTCAAAEDTTKLGWNSNVRVDYYNYSYNGSSCASGSFCSSSYGGAAASPPDVSSFVAALSSPKRQKRMKCDINDQSNSKMIGIVVETENNNLYDGYVWRKYGEKRIKNEEHTRSYFRCASNGCSIRKQIQRQSKTQIMFTYLGRHNHHNS